MWLLLTIFSIQSKINYQTEYFDFDFFFFFLGREKQIEETVVFWEFHPPAKQRFAVTKMADTIKIERSHSPKPYRRAKIGSLFSFFSKFASDSDVNSSLKTIAGRKKEDGKGHAIPFSSNGKTRLADKLVLEELHAKVEKTKEEIYNAINKQHKVAVKCVDKSGEDWQTKMEKMQEDMNDIEQKHEVSAKLVEGSVPLKKTQDEDIKGSDLLLKNRKKVFIRSRL